jgi:hypothetical protein
MGLRTQMAIEGKPEIKNLAPMTGTTSATTESNIVGGPGDDIKTSEAAKPALQSEAPKEVQDQTIEQVKPEPKPTFEIGDQKFDSPEALLAHAKELQSKIDAQPSKTEVAKAAIEEGQTSDSTGASKEDVEDELLLLTNPKKARAQIKAEAKEEAKQEILGILDAREADKTFWKSFYKDHPELDNFRDLVSVVHQQNYEELRTLKLPEARAKLGTLARNLFERIKDHSQTTEVAEGKVSALTTSGETAPNLTPAKTENPNATFMDQLSTLQNKKPRR